MGLARNLFTKPLKRNSNIPENIHNAYRDKTVERVMNNDKITDGIIRSVNNGMYAGFAGGAITGGLIGAQSDDHPYLYGAGMGILGGVGGAAAAYSTVGYGIRKRLENSGIGRSNRYKPKGI